MTGSKAPDGGSGTVILKYPSAYTAVLTQGSALTLSTTTQTGYKVTTINLTTPANHVAAPGGSASGKVRLQLTIVSGPQGGES